MEVPSKYYEKNNTLCKDKPKLRLLIGQASSYELMKIDKKYVCSWKDQEIEKQIARLNEFGKIKQKITIELLTYSVMIKKLTEERKKFESLNTKPNLLKIAKLINPKAKDAPSPAELRKQIGSNDEIIKKLKKKNLYEWVEIHDRLLKKILSEIPLKEVDKEFKYSGTFNGEKKKAQAELKNLQNALEKQIRTSSRVILRYGRVDYEQFPVKDILP